MKYVNLMIRDHPILMKLCSVLLKRFLCLGLTELFC